MFYIFHKAPLDVPDFDRTRRVHLVPQEGAKWTLVRIRNSRTAREAQTNRSELVRDFQNFGGPSPVRDFEIFLGPGPSWSEISKIVSVLVQTGSRTLAESLGPGTTGLGPWIPDWENKSCQNLLSESLKNSKENSRE